MLLLKTLSFLFLAFVSGSKEKDGYRIWNGKNSNLLPYQVQLSGEFLCGGTLIRSNWVLTAQHCVVKDYENKDFTKLPTTIFAGFVDNRFKGKAKRRKVSAESITLNPSTDLALIRIRKPFKKSLRIRPIPINDVKPNLIGRKVLISGWGLTENGRPPNRLQITSVRINRYVNRKPGRFNSFLGRYLVSRSHNGKGSDQGDSGGPVVIGGRFGKLLVGVTSFGPNDTENNGLRKNFDVDVFHYADWIMNTINSKGTGRRKIVQGGKRCRDRGYKPITNPRQCRSIARKFRIPVKRSIKRGNRNAPTGCNIVTTEIGGSFQRTVRFNNVRFAASKGNNRFRPICTI